MYYAFRFLINNVKPKAKSILFEVYSPFFQFNWYSKLLGFKIIANCDDISLKSYRDYLVEFVT